MVRRLLCWVGLLAARLSVVAYDVAIWAENRIHEIDREADRVVRPEQTGPLKPWPKLLVRLEGEERWWPADELHVRRR